MLLALVLLAAAPDLPGALRARVSVPSARVELLAWSPPPRCPATTLDVRTFHASGDVAVLVRGPGCQAWGTARVRVLVPAAVTTRRVDRGEPLDGAVALEWRELSPGATRPLDELPRGALAASVLPAGTVLTDASLRTGRAPGARVTVLLQLNGVVLEQPAVLIGCGARRHCAALPSGRRVEGTLDGDRLLARLEEPR